MTLSSSLERAAPPGESNEIKVSAHYLSSYAMFWLASMAMARSRSSRLAILQIAIQVRARIRIGTTHGHEQSLSQAIRQDAYVMCACMHGAPCLQTHKGKTQAPWVLTNQITVFRPRCCHTHKCAPCMLVHQMIICSLQTLQICLRVSLKTCNASFRAAPPPQFN